MAVWQLPKYKEKPFMVTIYTSRGTQSCTESARECLQKTIIAHKSNWNKKTHVYNRIIALVSCFQRYWRSLMKKESQVANITPATELCRRFSKNRILWFMLVPVFVYFILFSMCHSHLNLFQLSRSENWRRTLVWRESPGCRFVVIPGIHGEASSFHCWWHLRYLWIRILLFYHRLLLWLAWHFPLEQTKDCIK